MFQLGNHFKIGHEKRAIRSINQFSNFFALNVDISRKPLSKHISDFNSTRSIQFSLTVYGLPIFVFCSDFKCIRPTHILIVRTLSENEINNFTAQLSHLLFRRITFKTNFKLFYDMVYPFSLLFQF